MPRRAERLSSGDAACILCLLLAVSAIADDRHVSPEQTLWQEVTALDASLSQGPAGQEWFSRAVAQRRRLLAKLQLYVQLYPGGTHRDAAVQRELETLFEIGALTGGDIGPLRERVQAYLAGQWPPAVRHEAAYWEVVCRHADSASAAQPTTCLTEPSRALLDDYYACVRDYPASRHTPRLAVILFDDAMRRGDSERMRWLVTVVRGHDSGRQIGELLAGRLDRLAAVGRPFPLKLRPEAVTATHEAVGVAALVVIWDSMNPACRACVTQIEEFRRVHPQIVVIGVNVDPTRERFEAARTELGIAWPQVYDGLGRATWFARRWGVRRVPFVFVRGADGLLVGSGPGDAWRELAERALSSGSPD